FGKQRMLLKPSDILFYQGSEVIDPLPVEMVMAAAKRQKYLRSSTERQVDKHFGDATLRETTLYPNETYRGVMFFALPAAKRPLDRFFTPLSILRDDEPKMRIGLTNLESGERVLFAPFAL